MDREVASHVLISLYGVCVEKSFSNLKITGKLNYFFNVWFTDNCFRNTIIPLKNTVYDKHVIQVAVATKKIKKMTIPPFLDLITISPHEYRHILYGVKQLPDI